MYMIIDKFSLMCCIQIHFEYKFISLECKIYLCDELLEKQKQIEYYHFWSSEHLNFSSISSWELLSAASVFFPPSSEKGAVKLALELGSEDNTSSLGRAGRR